MKFILGKKQKMTVIFDTNGKVYPVTIVKTGPVVVTRIKDEKTDGYKAIQVGFGVKKAKNISKPDKGQMKDLGDFELFKEFLVEKNEESSLKIGDKIDASIFGVGDKISVSAISKGKGFQGVVKRHGFKGGPRSHGQKHSEREPGSIGGGLRNKVPKNMRMAGRMGNDRTTVRNLTVVKTDPSVNEIFISGAVPGRRGTLVEIRG